MVLLGALTAATSVGQSLSAQSAQPDRPPRPDTTRERVVIRPDRPTRRRSEPPPFSRRGRLPELDPSVAAGSYRDARARETIGRARLARAHQDSTLTSYDATVKQRLSAGLNVK